MSETVKIQPHPVLQELKFPRRNLITLDISKFDPDSAEECYKAVQEAIRGMNNEEK